MRLMQKATDLDTKEKILDVATNLFAQKGFSGTSVRDIAQQAGVNLAAINYHFSNKRNLLQAVIHHGYDVLKDGVLKLEGEKSESFVDFSMKVYDLMLQHGNLTLNMMKIMLSEEAKGLDKCADPEDVLIGPPGGHIMFAVLTKEVGEEIPEEKRMWAVRTVFSLIFHKVTMLNSYICHQPEMKEIFTPELMRQGIEDLASMIVKNFRTDD